MVAVKVEFNFALLPGQKQIDAIGISDSATPIEAKINTIPIFENLPNPECWSLGIVKYQNVIISQDGQQIFYSLMTKKIKTWCIRVKKKPDGKWSNPVARTQFKFE